MRPPLSPPEDPVLELSGAPSTQTRLRVPISNPSNIDATLASFATSCGCAKPEFSQVLCRSRANTSVEIVLNTEQMARSFPSGGTVSLYPMLVAEDGNTVESPAINIRVNYRQAIFIDKQYLVLEEDGGSDDAVIICPSGCHLEMDYDHRCLLVTTKAFSETEGQSRTKYAVSVASLSSRDSKSTERPASLTIWAIAQDDTKIGTLTIPIRYFTTSDGNLSPSIFVHDSPDTHFEVETKLHGIEVIGDSTIALVNNGAIQLIDYKFFPSQNKLALRCKRSTECPSVVDGDLVIQSESRSYVFNVRFCFLSVCKVR